MKISREMQRKFDLVNALTLYEQPTLANLQAATNIPTSSIKRQLNALRDEFGMNIMFIRSSNGERGGYGYYLLTDWGILDRASFLLRYGRR